MTALRSGRSASRALLVSATLVFAVGATPAAAQSLAVGDPVEAYLRLLQISGDAELGSFMTRPLRLREDGAPVRTDVHPWAGRLAGFGPVSPSGDRLTLEPVEARLRAFGNLRYPTVANDGFLWQGRGLTTELEVGTTLRWRGVSVSVRPSIAFTQNASFTLAPVSDAALPEYGYPWRTMDLPQRFGPDAFWTLDAGQSELRVDSRGATIGFGTRNLWWGPGRQNAIVMSNNAGGIPHAFLGTRGPRDIGIGTLEANWIWGRLTQSDWFDPAVAGDARFLTGLVLTYGPEFLPGLHVGFSRVFYGWVPDGGQPLGDLFMVVQGVRKRGLADPSNPAGNDETDQVLSLFARWVLPESGFEVYTEWARNDHAWDLFDFLLEPEHSQAYTLGLQKSMELARGNRLALHTELTHLERSGTFRVRPNPVYYSHHIVTPGYTQRGQVIGAAIGPGGNQQHVGVDLYAPWGMAGVFLQRRVQDNDAYYDWAAANGVTFDRHDVSIDIGARGSAFVGAFELGGGLTYVRQLNRYFFGRKVNDVRLEMSARWRAGSE